jgi:AraC-like DNA-binding protein
MAVKSELEKLGFHPITVELGEVEIQENDIDKQKEKLCFNLGLIGFELIDDKASKTIDKIKTLIIDLVHHKNNDLSITLSEYLSQQLLQDYHSLSKLFSAVEHLTIEHYFIKQKIEKVKELLLYDEMTLSQIADLLQYSSVAYLSNQFKKETGFTTSYFKQLKTNKRKGIENIT